MKRDLTFGVPFVCVSMEILAMFEFPSLFNGAAYLNKRRVIVRASWSTLVA